MSAYANLRRRRQLFVDHYVATGVASAAAIKAGYSEKTCIVQGAKIMANPEVKAAIAERTEDAIARSGVTLANVLGGASHRASADRTAIFGDDGKLLPLSKWPEEFKACVESLEFNDKGQLVKVRTSSRNEAAKLLLQYLKVPEVHELQGKGGGPIETVDRTEITDLEKARRIAFQLAQGLRATQPQPQPNPEDDSGVSTSTLKHKQET